MEGSYAKQNSTISDDELDGALHAGKGEGSELVKQTARASEEEKGSAGTETPKRSTRCPDSGEGTSAGMHKRKAIRYL